MANDILGDMPANSVSLLSPPFARWHDGSLYEYDATRGWYKVGDMPEDQLGEAEKTMLARTRILIDSNNLAIKVKDNKGNTVYAGGWTGAPEPVAQWVRSAAQVHPDLKTYLQQKGGAASLIMRGYTLEVL